ncbi:MAG: NADH-quinone oxidoreductase subunit F, partial [Eubacteriales bacterium]|nr:NADH-quinone oxidoreductase subunit F [Eubacteriales bacterium]
MIQNIEDLTQARETAAAEMKSYDCRVLVCSGTGCIATGSNKIHQLFQELIADDPAIDLQFAPHDAAEHDGPKVGVHKTGCQGFCELGPLVRIQKGDRTVQYVKVQPEDVKEIYEHTILGNDVIERLLYQKGEKKYVQPEDIPFIAKQTRIVLENCGKLDAESLDEYLAAGGFKALEKAMFQMDRDQVIEEIDKSGLRGRGGGGFPAGRKWEGARKQKAEKKYIVCNGDEGDPGAFMDRSIMEGNPHSVIEGMMIAGRAVGAHDGYIYVRAEYPLAVSRLKAAIAKAEEYGLLGDRIMGTDFS